MRIMLVSPDMIMYCWLLLARTDLIIVIVLGRHAGDGDVAIAITITLLLCAHWRFGWMMTSRIEKALV